MNTVHATDDSLIEGLARVVAVDSAMVWLSAEQPAACGSCATRGACGGGASKPSASWRVPRSLGANQAPLALGEVVRVGVDRNALTRASLTAYALPLGAMLMAAIALQDAGDLVAILAALLGLLLGAVVAKVLVRRWRHSLAPVVLGRSLASAGSSCAPASTAGLRALDIPVIHKRSL